MNRFLLDLVESGLLFLALVLTLPYVPSNDVGTLPFGGTGALAIVPFAASRLLRWGRRYLLALLETVAFAAFAWVANAVANLLYAM